MPLSHDFAHQTSTLRDVTEDVLDSTNPPTPFNRSCELEEAEEFESASEFDKHHAFNESEDIFEQESCKGVVEPTKLEFDDDNFSMDYKYFSCGLTSMRV